MAHRFTEAELGVMKEAFSHFDKDGDGTISAQELGVVMRSLEHVMVNLGEKFTEERIAHMIKGADEDGDRKLSYEEFLKLMMEK